jgi:purine-binding chemotaxis protein CheW
MTSDNTAAVQAVTGEDTAGTQYLTFLLADEQYGLNILRVQEIRGWEQVTRIPNSPHYLQGVINLRGTIVPVLDLRLRFQLPASDYTKETVVIVVRDTDRSGCERSLGIVVDAVSDVLIARDEEVIATPDFGANVPTENIHGLVSAAGHMVMLLDVASLLETDASAAEAGA